MKGTEIFMFFINLKIPFLQCKLDKDQLTANFFNESKNMGILTYEIFLVDFPFKRNHGLASDFCYMEIENKLLMVFLKRRFVILYP
jgi:hypothetical protein